MKLLNTLNWRHAAKAMNGKPILEQKKVRKPMNHLVTVVG